MPDSPHRQSRRLTTPSVAMVQNHTTCVFNHFAYDFLILDLKFGDRDVPDMTD